MSESTQTLFFHRLSHPPNVRVNANLVFPQIVAPSECPSQRKPCFSTDCRTLRMSESTQSLFFHRLSHPPNVRVNAKLVFPQIVAPSECPSQRKACFSTDCR